MSPDPPREDTGEEENRIRRFSGDFMEGMMNDEEFFIVPDAPYELDMEEESDYSDSDEEAATGGGANSQTATQSATGGSAQQLTVTLDGEEQEFLFQEGQGRGRYRLLIPFPNPTTEDVTDTVVASQSNDQRNLNGINQENNATSGSEIEDNNAQIERTNQSQSLPEENSTDKHPSSSGHAAPKREIELTDEKVEKIKEVMKNITLPSTSIPNWASEIDEDSWKKKLNDSISSTRLTMSSKTDKKPTA